MVYEGDVIDKTELPNNSNSAPWTAVATTITKFPRINLTWTNFLTLQGGYKGIVQDGRVQINGERLANYRNENFDKAFIWDTKFIFDIPFLKTQFAYLSIDISNVLNTKSAISVNDRGIIDYDVGRRIWLEAGYKW